MTEQYLSYKSDHIDTIDNIEGRIFYEFNSNYFIENLDIILSLENSKKIIELKDNIERLNKSYVNILDISHNKRKLIAKLGKQYKKTDSYKCLYELLDSYSFLLNFFIYLHGIPIGLNRFKKTNTYYRNDSRENINYFFTNFNELNDEIIKDLKDINEETFNEGSIKLKLITKVNKYLLLCLRNTFVSYSLIEETRETRLIIDCLIKDYQFTGQPLKVLRELENIEIE